MAKPIKIWDGSQWVDVAINTPDISNHIVDTTDVHGISNTANLVYTSDSRLTDSRTPTAHASSHGSAGSDAITIAQSQVTNLTTDLSAKASLASPTFTGTPAAPTAAVGTDTTQVATTAFVNAEISNDAILKSLLDAKADLLTATADNTPARLAVGTNGYRLEAASGESTGLRWAADPVCIAVAVSDETTAITTGTAKVTFRMPWAMTVTAVRASLSTASSSGNPTFDINEGGTSILGANKLSIDANEKTSTTAAIATSISDSTLADDAEITIDIDTAGTGAKGAKVYLIGTKT